MEKIIYPKYIVSTNDKNYKLYWDYIKLWFKFKLNDDSSVTDYYDVICIDYNNFLFRITRNYKIETRMNHKADESYMKDRIERISEIINIYYPLIYD